MVTKVVLIRGNGWTCNFQVFILNCFFLFVLVCCEGQNISLGCNETRLFLFFGQKNSRVKKWLVVVYLVYLKELP